MDSVRVDWSGSTRFGRNLKITCCAHKNMQIWSTDEIQAVLYDSQVWRQRVGLPYRPNHGISKNLAWLCSLLMDADQTNILCFRIADKQFGLWSDWSLYMISLIWLHIFILFFCNFNIKKFKGRQHCSQEHFTQRFFFLSNFQSEKYVQKRSPREYHNCNYTVKPVSSGHLKMDKKKVLKTNGSLMKVESMTECYKRAFCNTFDLH